MKAESISLIPVMKNNGQFDEWQMSVNGGGKKGAGQYPIIKVAHNDASNFTLTITDPGSITFSANPIYIQKGTAKPTGGVDSQIKDIQGQGTTVLTFHDSNKDAGKLTYVLNFNNAPQLDPIIENGGGGIGGGGISDYSIYLLGAAVLAVLAVALIRRVMRAKPQQQGPGGD
jgi:hypothetical protein